MEADQHAMGSPYQRCTRCGREGTFWSVVNEQYVCTCGMDESGIELKDPGDNVNKFAWSKRLQRDVFVVDYIGGSSYRVIDRKSDTKIVAGTGDLEFAQNIA